MPVAMPIAPRRTTTRTAAAATLVAAAALLLAGCGGGNPLGNPSDVQNPPSTGGQKLSFDYFQRYVNPILLTPLQVNQGGLISTATCASGGCHDTVNGTGGALRIVQGAPPVTDLSNPDVVRTSDMYKNFYSSQGSTVIGSVAQSRLVNKPLVQGTLHGGGLIFDSPDHPCAQIIEDWISNPMPSTQDEFGPIPASLLPPTAQQLATCSPP